MATSAHGRGDAGGTTTLVVSGKSPEDQQLLASAAFSLSLGERDSVEEIAVSLDAGAGAGAAFDAGAYMAALRVSRFGRWMLWSPRLTSTHDLVTRNFAKLPVGVVCVADVQFNGRGRSKNVWESPAGCLMFSFTSQMEDARKLPLMQYVACLAMTEAIKELCCAKGLPELEVKIKWPNDLYLKGLKVGGILCTSFYQPKVYNICTGIGLNVDNEKPTTCLNAALKELKANSPTLKREDILASFFNKFEVLFEIFSNEGFQALEEQYYNSWLHSGQKVVVQDGHEAQRSDSVVTIQGLTPAGYLYAIGEDGKSYELHPDGNRYPWLRLPHESNSTHLLRPSSSSSLLFPHRSRSAGGSTTRQDQPRAPMAEDDSVVSAQWLHEHLGQPDVKVLDASWYMPVENRDPWQEYQVAHIPAALFFDIDGIIDRTTDLPHMLPSGEAFAAAVSALDIKNHDKVVVYDGKGFFSAPRVWWMFRVYGHNKVWVLDGGLPQWRTSGFDLESGTPGDAILKTKAANSVVEMIYNGQLASATTFQTEFQPQLFWTLQKVKHNIAAKTHQVVDARSKGRFDGVAPEPREGVRSGHILGTKCVPFPEMFDDAPMLLPADEIRKKFEQAGLKL
ncbi:hypothetical protein E2562_029467 [Oryza meyeriana var. granulata]|uniref:3-mercaptopyruvate sulfurtransferase n=1 Tax=Oryza meyeriana var. granulata TaxID=110450 RepID=A0A6G1E4H8_9ORYZ|nr:hypothetical protein E2562_029467 [Oryza meyeriana var. granulata]